MIEESQMIEIENYMSVMERMQQITDSIALKNVSSISTKKSKQLLLENVYPQRKSVVDGMRTIALKLVFGAFHNQIFER
ncbi:hypothetical protein J5N97_003806 [Dioscorea zingiberensis]|uniref:Uncharacterized protein n=1 Tax=Dioscorea zingiberensis TaxID=325984 RepID=A0A9D5D7D5_9LILI|nr:hypothetical protein J5N97_003806 [Dioscorea zingiberensis]